MFNKLRYVTHSSSRRLITSRGLSTQTTAAIEKLRNAFEHYRQIHYTQEIPTRFKKDVVRAATKDTHEVSDFVAIEGLQRVLFNIGAGQRVSQEDVQAIFNELGDDTGRIQAKTMIQIL